MLEAINDIETMDFPVTDVASQEGIEAGFSKCAGYLSWGCMGAVDGLAIQVRRPYLSETSNPVQFANRKGYYLVNVQAICDAGLCFCHISIESCGRTHDWSAWRLSPLHCLLEEKGLPPGFWIAGGDDAYVT